MRAPLDRLSALLPRETTLLADDSASPTAARNALPIELSALGVAGRDVAHVLDAIAMADLQPGPASEREVERRRSRRDDPA